jgi:N-acetylneuraminic acid mutarotase
MRKAIALFVLLYAGFPPAGLQAQGGKWEIVKTNNTATNCSECGFAAVNDKIYLIGGDGRTPKPVECFNPKTLTWTMLGHTPVIMHHFQAVPYKNKIYVLDAFSSGGFPDQVPMANVYSFDTKTNTWEKGGEIPADRRRAGAAAVEYKGKLYLIAGITHGHSSGTNSMFDCYDPVTKTWTSLPDAPHIRDHCFGAVIKDKLYIVGGRNTSFRDPENKIPFFAKTMLDVDVFDFASGKWSTLSARLPKGSGGGALVNLNNVLYYMGGERATDTERNAPRKNTFYFDPANSSQWIETDSLNFARNGTAAAVYNNKIYLAGGSGGPPPAMNPNGNPPSNPPGQMPPPQGNRPPNSPEQNRPVDLEVFTVNH